MPEMPNHDELDKLPRADVAHLHISNELLVARLEADLRAAKDWRRRLTDHLISRLLNLDYQGEDLDREGEPRVPVGEALEVHGHALWLDKVVTERADGTSSWEYRLGLARLRRDGEPGTAESTLRLAPPDDVAGDEE